MVANQEKSRFCALKFILTLFLERQQNICSCETPFAFRVLKITKFLFLLPNLKLHNEKILVNKNNTITNVLSKLFLLLP